MPAPQSYKTHRKYVLGYHGVLFSLLLLNLVWAIRQAIREPSGDELVEVAVAVALFLIAFYARVFALKAQDRVIRLEERMRLARLLPADLQGRIGELSSRQLIALRFASDGELPALTRRVLDEGIREENRIKEAIKDWRADHHRL